MALVAMHLMSFDTSKSLSLIFKLQASSRNLNDVQSGMCRWVTVQFDHPTKGSHRMVLNSTSFSKLVGTLDQVIQISNFFTAKAG